VGEWQNTGINYPLSVSEAQGAMIGSAFCIVSGFWNGINKATPEIHCIDTLNLIANWVQQDSLTADQSLVGNDLSLGVTHGGFVVVGSKFYMCGGYIGGHPGLAIKDCFVYDHAMPSGQQITAFTSLPEDRAGGGMLYDEANNILIFSAGARMSLNKLLRDKS